MCSIVSGRGGAYCPQCDKTAGSYTDLTAVNDPFVSFMLIVATEINCLCNLGYFTDFGPKVRFARRSYEVVQTIWALYINYYAKF